MAQIRQVVSESLQATVRRLLPSQQGFTEDLQASNVIMPVIDLTPTAEGSSLPTDLSRALNYGNVTSHTVNNTQSTLINNTGFYRIFGVTLLDDNAAGNYVEFEMTDGVTPKRIWRMQPYGSGGVANEINIPVDFIVFLAAGESITVDANGVNTYFYGSSQQVADISGNLVNPSGFTAS